MKKLFALILLLLSWSFSYETFAFELEGHTLQFQVIKDKETGLMVNIAIWSPTEKYLKEYQKDQKILIPGRTIFSLIGARDIIDNYVFFIEVEEIITGKETNSFMSIVGYDCKVRNKTTFFVDKSSKDYGDLITNSPHTWNWSIDYNNGISNFMWNLACTKNPRVRFVNMKLDDIQQEFAQEGF